MPLRATKRGSERTALHADCDVLICGASFAGLAVARELAGSGAKVLIVDRYEIGERQTSACGIPTQWLAKLSLQASLLQTFHSLRVHTPWASVRWELPWSFSTFDYRALCALLWEQAHLPATSFETAKVDSITRAWEAPTGVIRPGEALTGVTGAGEALTGITGDGDALTGPKGAVPRAGAPAREGRAKIEAQMRFGAPHTVHTDRGDIKAPFVVDALGWRRVLAQSFEVQPPNARLSRGLEVHPHGDGEEMELWIDHRYVRAGYGWSFPAREEVRVGIGSFWPQHHVKEPTVRLASDLRLPADGFQGNWIPHALRPATEGGVFFVGDSAGHCLPLTAEGIRTALYFGIACGRELRAAIDGRSSRALALQHYGAFSDAHQWKFKWLLRSQRLIGSLTNTPAVTGLAHAMRKRAFSKWAFERYLNIAPPSFVDGTTPITPSPRPQLSRTASAR